MTYTANNGKKYRRIEDLEADFACDYLDARDGFTRVTTEPEESAWYCETCGEIGHPDDGCANCSEE